MPAIRLCLFGPVQLLVRDGATERPLPVQPKPLALLLYLALDDAGGGPVRRDVLLARFWPDLDDARARAALRQALFHLRRVVGAPALPVRPDDSVALAPGSIDCDAVAFDLAIARDAPAEALSFYRAPLLEGYHVDGVSPELDQWWDAARARYAQAAHRAAWTLAERAEAAGDAVAAGRTVRRALALAPYDEPSLRRGLALLERIGDIAGALALAAAFARRLREEFGATPDVATRAFVARLRTSAGPPDGREAAAAMPRVLGPPPGAGARPPATAGVDPPTGAGSVTRVAPGRRARRGAVGVGLALAVALGIFTRARARAPATVRQDVLDPAAITAQSPLTRRLFAEGLTRLYHESDPVEAARLFESALREDSSCAMCAYAAARADLAVDMGLSRRLLRTAVRLSGRVSRVERLVIRQWWASLGNAPEQLALADSLAAQFPDDPEVVLARGSALEVEGRFADALACYTRLLREASSAGEVTCPRCEAYAAVVRAYGAADSIDAAVRAAQEWTRGEPRSAAAWMGLASALALADRPDAALAAVDAAEQGEGRPGVGAALLARAALALRAERYAAADTALRVVAAHGTAVERQSALWWWAILLRYRGRPREALALVEGPLRWSERRGLALAAYPHTLMEGQILLESGRAREAALLFRALSVQREPEDSGMPGMVARKRAWALTHAATALAAVGDTGAVAALADTVEREGRGSALARDHHLHEYVRGLVWAARGEPERAREAFRRATLSRTHGFTRASLAEAQLLVATGRAREAIPLLALTLRGELEGSNLYVTRPELHETLARAYDAVGRPDSAGTHWEAVAWAWAGGEDGYRARADTASSHLARDGRHGRAIDRGTADASHDGVPQPPDGVAPAPRRGRRDARVGRSTGLRQRRPQG